MNIAPVLLYNSGQASFICGSFYPWPTYLSIRISIIFTEVQAQGLTYMYVMHPINLDIH